MILTLKASIRPGLHEVMAPRSTTDLIVMATNQGASASFLGVATTHHRRRFDQAPDRRVEPGGDTHR
jgi:hypothetical protein